MLNKSDILSPRKPAMESIDVPDWGGKVNIRVMSGADLDQYYSESYTLVDGEVKANQVNCTARLLVKCICDEDGKRLLEDADAEALGQQGAAILEQLKEVAKRLNKMGGDVEKNS
jgi:hypothetical protein